MSSPATTFRLFYPDTNTVNAVALHDATGAALTPQTIADGTGDPAGFKSKVLSFAAASEPLFAAPTFANPASPVAVYLCRDEAGVFKKVLDESLFDSATPGRPTVAVTALQEHLLFVATDLGGGIKTYAVKAPVSPVCLVKDAGKDAVTGEDLEGNTILLRWSGVVPTLVEVEADIEDITDPGGYFPVAFSNITTYAESSVGLSLLKSDSEIVPRDGLGHAVNFRLRYNVNGDAGAWVVVNNAFITYQMQAPASPTSLTVQLLRDRTDTIPDVVKVDWVKNAPPRPAPALKSSPLTTSARNTVSIPATARKRPAGSRTSAASSSRTPARPLPGLMGSPSSRPTSAPAAPRLMPPPR